MKLSRRRALVALGVLAAAAAGRAVTAPRARRVEVLAHRFEFVPSEIIVARGTTLTLAITATDFTHGFSMPDFGLRKDLVPGRVVEVTLEPGTPGRFHYFCDNFCGEGHDNMGGILVVT